MKTQHVLWLLIVAVAAVFVTAGIFSAWPDLQRSSENHDVTGRMMTTDGRTFAYQMQLASGWADKVTVHADGNLIVVEHILPQAMAAHIPQADLFTICALTETEWAEAQQWPHYGEVLQTLDGVIFYYSHPLDNPYSISEDETHRRLAEEYQRMFSQSHDVAASFQATASE